MSGARKRVVLISNTVMHYRVSVYNYLHKRFGEEGWDWIVLTNEVQPQNRIPAAFQMEVIPFRFSAYRERLKELKPDAVILFLHLKDRMIWPLIHWLKLSGIPFGEWTKTRNLDDVDNRIKNAMFNYVHRLSDGLVLYSEDLRRYLPKSQLPKTFAANNTINHEAFPAITESKAELKKRFNIPFKKVVLFVGRMGIDGGRKRVDHLIEIFRDLEGHEAGLVIVGSGMQPDWQARMNPCTTIYLGEVHDPENREIARIFSLADLCVIPGHVGLGLNQALFYGLPVVTMEGKQPPEIMYLHHGNNGFVVPEGNVAQLKSRILELLDDDNLRNRFATEAKAGFMREASIEGMYQGFKKCIDFICSKRS